MHQEMLDNRAERQRREERQRADHDDGGDEQPDEERAVRRAACRPRSARASCWPGCPRPPSAGRMNRNRPNSIARPSVRSYHGVLTVMPAKALPLFSDALEYA